MIKESNVVITVGNWIIYIIQFKLIIFKKILCLIEKNINYFKYENFIKVLIVKLNEVILLLDKKPEYDIGLNLKTQCYFLKNQLKKI
jgi:hypothetical protein